MGNKIIRAHPSANYTRRRILQSATTVGTVLALNLRIPSAFSAEFDWKRYSGTKLRMMANRIEPGDLLIEQFSEFQAKTGIEIDVQQLPEEQYRQRIVVEMTAGNSDIDLFMTLIGNEGVQFLRAGWYEPIEPYFAKADQMIPDYDRDDIGAGAWRSQRVDGVLVALPIELGGLILMINKTMFEKAGIAAPTNLEEMEAAAKRLTDRDNNIFGVSLRGRRGQAVGIFSNFFHNFGAEWLDKDGQPSINTPEAIAAFEYYGRLLREYGPPGSTNHHFTEVNSMLVSGRAAMIVEGTVFAGIYEDPTRSEMAGQIGYHPMPVGPGGDHPVVNGWGVAMHSRSRNKDANWLFMQWATSRGTLLNLAMAGQGSPRASIWNDAGYQAASNSPEDWRRATAHTIQVGTPLFAPPVIPVLEVRDIIGDVIVAAINGDSVKPAADAANDKFKTALEKA